MNKSEVALVLAKCAAYDNREPDEARIEAWANSLDPEVTLQDAYDAVAEHFRHSNDWIMPAHVNRACRNILHARVTASLRDSALTPPEALGGDPQLEAAWKRDVLAAISAGLPRAAAETRANNHAGITPATQITTPHDTRALAAGIGA